MEITLFFRKIPTITLIFVKIDRNAKNLEKFCYTTEGAYFCQIILKHIIDNK